MIDSASLWACTGVGCVCGGVDVVKNISRWWDDKASPWMLLMRGGLWPSWLSLLLCWWWEATAICFPSSPQPPLNAAPSDVTSADVLTLFTVSPWRSHSVQVRCMLLNAWRPKKSVVSTCKCQKQTSSRNISENYQRISLLRGFTPRSKKHNTTSNFWLIFLNSINPLDPPLASPTHTHPPLHNHTCVTVDDGSSHSV